MTRSGSGEIAYHELLHALNPRVSSEKPSVEALDPNNKQHAFRYGKHDAEEAAKLIERPSGIRDEDYETMEAFRKKQRNHQFRS